MDIYRGYDRHAAYPFGQGTLQGCSRKMEEVLETHRRPSCDQGAARHQGIWSPGGLLVSDPKT